MRKERLKVLLDLSLSLWVPWGIESGKMKERMIITVFHPHCTLNCIGSSFPFEHFEWGMDLLKRRFTLHFQLPRISKFLQSWSREMCFFRKICAIESKIKHTGKEMRNDSVIPISDRLDDSIPSSREGRRRRKIRDHQYTTTIWFHYP